MDQFLLKKHLAQAESHVAQGERQIARQKQIIATLEGDVAHARELLAKFEEVQALHVADRDRLEKELAENSNQNTTAAHARKHAR
jgi:ATP-dependent protease HslVU (ClpYQ) peptidase subunit